MYPYLVLQTRSLKPERIDAGDYTPAEYDRFLKEIALINRLIGDSRALRKTLISEIEKQNLKEFSVLDVGAGSGELLRTIAKFAVESGRTAQLTGLELNEQSLNAMKSESANFPNINPICGDALCLPFPDKSFDFTICSLFTHHFTDENIVKILQEFSRVACQGFYVIDLHRHPIAYASYKLFCALFRISPLVRHDGSLSVLRGFKPPELIKLATQAGIINPLVTRIAPFRLVLSGS